MRGRPLADDAEPARRTAAGRPAGAIRRPAPSARVSITMLFFGVGAAIPLLALGLFSRDAMLRWRQRVLLAGQNMKTVLGLALVFVGALVLAGLDKSVESLLVSASPLWLTNLTTRF